MKIHHLSTTEAKSNTPQRRPNTYHQWWAIEHKAKWNPATYEYIPNPEGYTQEEIDKMLEDTFHALAKNEKRRQTILRFIDYMDLHPTSTEGAQA